MFFASFFAILSIIVLIGEITLFTKRNTTIFGFLISIDKSFLSIQVMFFI